MIHESFESVSARGCNTHQVKSQVTEKGCVWGDPILNQRSSELNRRFDYSDLDRSFFSNTFSPFLSDVGGCVA